MVGRPPGYHTPDEAVYLPGRNIILLGKAGVFCARAGVDRILYTSTVTVYPPMEVYREDLVWTANPHHADEFASWAKRMAEKFLEAQEIQYGVRNSVIVRPVNTFGPHDDFAPETALVVPALIGRALSGENPFTVWGDGSAVRDFLYVGDVADALATLIDSPLTGNINIGSGAPLSVADLALRVGELMERADLIRLGARVAAVPEAPLVLADISRLTAMGWRPRHSLDDGLAATIAWWRQHCAREVMLND